MRGFFKMFFASLLALIIFGLLIVLVLVTMIGSLTSKETPKVAARSVLVIDLGEHFAEQVQENPLGIISEGNRDIPGLYDVVRLVNRAAHDKDIAGIYLVAHDNPNGLAASMEIRNAILAFRKTGKFVLAQGDIITQRTYSIASAADKIYVSPQGYVEWFGYNANYLFLKGALDKLDIEPQIFYAGKFKSATEPFRTDRMTPENQLQTSVWLGDLYNIFLLNAAEVRNVDTATLHSLANEGKIRNAQDAVDNYLVDGLKYDDEVKDDIKAMLDIDKYEPVNFVTINTYYAVNDLVRTSGEKIALIYAEGDIMDGKSEQGTIGSETYRTIIRKARLDQTVKAIVFRVNSGGGSSIASENIWRELELAKEDKPVVVSFGDVAASGGYYISCAADSIFASPVTITGSIGVFGIIPNLKDFFKNKLGITFDGVKTGPYADAPSALRPMTDSEKKMLQDQVELIYSQFKQRVANGRKLDPAYVDSIAQGRVWSGTRAKELGLIDRFGGLDDAVRCAARMASLENYRLREYPEPENLLDKLLGKDDPLNYIKKLKKEMGEENYKLYLELKQLKQLPGTIQARLPFRFTIK